MSGPIISEDMAELASAGQIRPALFLRVASTPVIRAWTGVSTFPVPEDSVETDENAVYRGVGLITNFPVVEALINGVAQRMEVGLSGVDAEALALFQGDKTDLIGRVANFGMMFLGPDEQPACSMWWYRRGIVDRRIIRRRNGSRYFGLSIGTGRTDRRRPHLSFWIDQEHQKQYPGDLGLSRLPLHQNRTRKWPRWSS